MSASFDLDEVERGIVETPFAGLVWHLPSADSTMTLAAEAAAAGAATGVWVAEEQTAGRGRGGHAWHSAAGDGLYVSVLVRPCLTAAQAPRITLAAGLAAQAAILEVTELSPDIRWPNDLLFGERKCGGILVESVLHNGCGTEQASLKHAVIGIGINVTHTGFPPDLADSATSLAIEAGRSFRREPLLAALLRQLTQELAGLERGALDLSHLLDRFTRASTWVQGKRVRVGEQGGYTGWTRGLDDRGFLTVEDDAGVLRTVLSGSVRTA